MAFSLHPVCWCQRPPCALRPICFLKSFLTTRNLSTDTKLVPYSHHNKHVYKYSISTYTNTPETCPQIYNQYHINTARNMSTDIKSVNVMKAKWLTLNISELLKGLVILLRKANSFGMLYGVPICCDCCHWNEPKQEEGYVRSLLFSTVYILRVGGEVEQAWLLCGWMTVKLPPGDCVSLGWPYITQLSSTTFL